MDIGELLHKGDRYMVELKEETDIRGEGCVRLYNINKFIGVVKSKRSKSCDFRIEQTSKFVEETCETCGAVSGSCVGVILNGDVVYRVFYTDMFRIRPANSAELL